MVFKLGRIVMTYRNRIFFFKFFLSVCPIWLPIFSYFSMNEPELGAGIDPGMAFNPFPSSVRIRQGSNPQPLNCEFSLLTTRPDLCPNRIFLTNVPNCWNLISSLIRQSVIGYYNVCLITCTYSYSVISICRQM